MTFTCNKLPMDVVNSSMVEQFKKNRDKILDTVVT